MTEQPIGDADAPPCSDAQESQPITQDFVLALDTLARRLIRDLLREITRFEMLVGFESELYGLMRPLADRLQLAYLDGLQDSEEEEEDELLDGRTRAERAEAKAVDDLVQTVVPLAEAIAAKGRQVLLATSSVWKGFSEFAKAIDLEPDLFIKANDAEELRDLDSAGVDENVATGAHHELLRRYSTLATALAKNRATAATSTTSNGGT